LTALDLVIKDSGGTLADNEIDQEFIARQKQRLQDLKTELERVRDGLQEDERFRAGEEEDFTQHDSGDMSQSLFTREVDATIEHQVERRLQYVERALQKIEEGTYGLSDDSGEPIPRGRLEAVPEAIRTVEEQQQSREAYRHRGGQI
jgi:RNA polymerase-binding transcription factor